MKTKKGIIRKNKDNIKNKSKNNNRRKKGLIKGWLKREEE